MSEIIKIKQYYDPYKIISNDDLHMILAKMKDRHNDVFQFKKDVEYIDNTYYWCIKFRYKNDLFKSGFQHSHILAFSDCIKRDNIFNMLCENEWHILT